MYEMLTFIFIVKCIRWQFEVRRKEDNKRQIQCNN